MPDVDAQIMRLVLVRRTPDLAQQVLVGHDPTGVLCQDPEDGELFARQLDFGAGEAHAPAREVNREFAELYDRRWGLAVLVPGA